ncbi:hypothetical protein OIO90_003283 [Microbotryomycetes sp. JL221]|nr:hypothetical protein OIO90_003283 [Microbotryomycetes sp. JL221]
MSASTSSATAAGTTKLEGFQSANMSMHDSQGSLHSTMHGSAVGGDGGGAGAIDPSFLFNSQQQGGIPHNLFSSFEATSSGGNDNASDQLPSSLFDLSGPRHGAFNHDHNHFAPPASLLPQQQNSSNSVYDAFGFGKSDMFGAFGPDSTMLTPHLQATSLHASPFMSASHHHQTMTPPATTASLTAATVAPMTAGTTTSVASQTVTLMSPFAGALPQPPASLAAHGSSATLNAPFPALYGLSNNVMGTTDTTATTAATLAHLTAQANLESMFNSIMSPLEFARRNSNPAVGAASSSSSSSPLAHTPSTATNHNTNSPSQQQQLQQHPLHASSTAPASSSNQGSPATSSTSPAKARSKSLSQTRGRSSSSTRRKQSPPDSTGLGQSEQRGRSNQRRSSSQVGKAPSSSARSRSARRNAAAYQSMGTGGAAAQATAAAAAAQGPLANAPGTATATLPGSPAMGPLGVPSPVSLEDRSSTPTHPIAMPTIPSAPSSPTWYNSSPQSVGLGASQGTEHDFSSSVESGWRQGAEADSFSSMGSKKGTTLEDVPEDETRTTADPLTEKRRKRRESHNAVERRRRDNINERIQELATLLPEVLLEQACNDREDDLNDPNLGQSPSAAHLLPLPPLGTSPAQMAAMTAHLIRGTGNMVMGTAGNKPNKGVILAKSVEYIRYLQQLVELHTQRNVDLERIVHELRANSGAQNMQPAFQHLSLDGPNHESSTMRSAGDDLDRRQHSDSQAGSTDIEHYLPPSAYGDFTVIKEEDMQS